MPLLSGICETFRGFEVTIVGVGGIWGGRMPEGQSMFSDNTRNYVSDTEVL